MTASPPWQQAVTYGAVGGTKAADLLNYPPAGFRPWERRTRIGHGETRWQNACQRALSWQIQRRSGIRVLVQDSPPHVTENTYTPVEFGRDGGPIMPEPAEHGEVVYGAGGETLIAPGDTVTLQLRIAGIPVAAPCRVIYVLDEADRKGFAYGTLPGHPICGEEAFILERTEDGSVWLTVRAFWRPAAWPWWVAYPALRLLQSILVRRYFRALSGPAT